MLLLDELIVGDVGGEERFGLSRIGILSNLCECGSELVLAVLARDITAVAWDLCSMIIYRHDG